VVSEQGSWSSLCSGSREKQISPCRREGRGSHLIVKTGTPEEGVGQAGNPEMERQIRDLRARLEEMETTQRRGAGAVEFSDSEVEEEAGHDAKRSRQKMHQQRG
jgi:hypothetical protein